LTLPQARMLVIAYLLIAHPPSVKSMISIVDYYMERYYHSYSSHRKSKLIDLNGL